MVGIVMPAQTAQEPKVLGLSCEMVRRLVKTHTRDELEKMANSYGITPAQRRDLMQCLRKPTEQEQ